MYDAFHTQFAPAGITVRSEDLVLNLGMQSLSGEICWTSFDPEPWTGIIRDGDEIRVSKVEGFGIDAEVTDIDVPTSIITMVHKSPLNDLEYRANVLLPKTYKVSCGRSDETLLDLLIDFILQGGSRITW